MFKIIKYTYIIIIFPVIILTTHEKLRLFLEILVEYLRLLGLIHEAAISLLFFKEATSLNLFQKGSYIFILLTLHLFFDSCIRSKKWACILGPFIFYFEVFINVTNINTRFSAVQFIIHHWWTINGWHKHLVEFVCARLLFYHQPWRF